MKPLPAETAAIPKDEVLDHLRKVLASELFKGSERSTSLLRFLVEKAVSGQADRLKEYTLATEALGKGPAFDPRTDPIVRAEVSRLRTRLDKYYASEGLADAVTIALSKGSYVPQFQNRTLAPGRSEAPQASQPSASRNILWFAFGIGAAACVFAIVMFGLWRVAQPEDAVSIAVLPFANVSADPGQEFFSDGMTDEIAEALSKVRDLRIVARSSAYTFKNQNKPADAVGKALGATHLIEGSVRQAGNRVRITVQLIEADNGLQLWSASYDRDLTDIFATQEEIATAIAGALRVPLGLQQGQRLVPNRIDDVDSYQQYLRAKALVRGRTQSALASAVTLLEQVVVRDPEFAPGWALLAQAFVLTLTTHPARLGDSLDEFRIVADTFLTKAEGAARRAIQLDPQLGDGYLALGIAQTRRASLLQAEELYSKALTLDANNPDALHESSQLLASVGRIKEALAIRQKLQALEPFVPVFNWATATDLWVNGQNDAALAIFEDLPSDTPRAYFLAAFHAGAARYSEAADVLLQTPPEIAPHENVETAVRLLRTAPAPYASPETLPRLGMLGFVYLYAGAPSRALEFTEHDLDAGSFVPAFAVGFWHPSYAVVRKTERFKAYARKAGMVDYWRKRGWPDLCRPLGAEDFACD